MTHTFDSLISEYATRVADIIGASAPKATSPQSLIDLVRSASSSLNGAQDEQFQEASDDLTAAADHLADALTKDGTEQQMLFARAASHIRVALEFAG